ncbi:hypothetical protein BOTNAR_0406g00110 [Botryotinia narcissicola]|uniref:Uncharacterized protein n=1 Tax=Botryotinia narcissicola TaxID=278944 RepID=A0A4Z1HLW8_9HELO|nr:hypothetical protein BOTNAR_0406g00110 [Botryotinia narcissicola]
MCGRFSPKPRDIFRAEYVTYVLRSAGSVTATSLHITYQVDQTRWGKDTSSCFGDVDEWDAEYGVLVGHVTDNGRQDFLGWYESELSI